MSDLTALRARAVAHQDDIDLAVRFLTPDQLAERWSCSVSTVKAIPRDELPYKEIGRGRLLKRRRYHPADVAAYEAKDRGRAGA